MSAATPDGTGPAGLEVRLARQMLAQEDEIGTEILHALMGEDKRRAELEASLPEGTPDDSLEAALEILARDGLVDRRTDARQDPPVHRYELTPLGLQVVLTMQVLNT